MAYHVEPRPDGSYALEQDDRRHAGSRKPIASGSKEAMEQLKKWYERRRQVIFRIDPDVDDLVEQYKRELGMDKQAVFDEAMLMWRTFAQDPVDWMGIKDEASRPESPWFETLYRLCRDWANGDVNWPPPK